MKTIELYFGNNEPTKQSIINLLSKFFDNLSIEFIEKNENPFNNDITIYGTFTIPENKTDIFQSFFNQYKQII